MGQNRLTDTAVLIRWNLRLSAQGGVIDVNGRRQTALSIDRPGKQRTADLICPRIHGNTGKQIFLCHDGAEFFPFRGSVTVLPAVVQRYNHIVDDALLHQFDGTDMVVKIDAAAL